MIHFYKIKNSYRLKLINKVFHNNIQLIIGGAKSFSTNLNLLSDKGKRKATQEEEEKSRKEEQNRDKGKRKATQEEEEKSRKEEQNRDIIKEEESEDSLGRSKQERYDEEYAYYLQQNDMEQRDGNLGKRYSPANASELYNTCLAGPSNTNNTQGLAGPSNTNNTQDLAGPSNTNNSNIKYVASEHFNYLMEVNEEEQASISGLREEISDIQAKLDTGNIQNERHAFEDLIDMYRAEITQYEESISLRNHMADPENTPVPNVSPTTIKIVNEQFEIDIVNERAPIVVDRAAEFEAYFNSIRQASPSELADSEKFPNDPESSNPLETSSDDSLSSSEEEVQQSERNTSQEESNNQQEEIQYSLVKQDITEQEKIKYCSDEDSEKLQEFSSDEDSEGQENQSPSVELNSTEIRNPSSSLEQDLDPLDIFSDVLNMFDEEEKKNEENDNTKLESVHSSPISNNADVENNKDSKDKKNNDEENNKDSKDKKNNDEENGSDESGSNGTQDNGPSDDVGKPDIDSSNKRSLLIAELIINLINCIFGTDNNDNDDYPDDFYL